VDITRSLLEKRKIERELEENEDWFRDRQRRQSAAEAAERQRTELKQAEQRRLLWVQQWTQYALNSLPHDARREVEMEVHTLVQEALSVLQPSQPAAITQRLVDAAVHRALAPWTRRQEIERALKAGMNRLAWDVQFGSEYAPLKQRAWDAAVAAVRKVREEASYREMETAAVEAVQPMIREYDHQQACQRSRRILGVGDLVERYRAKAAAEGAKPDSWVFYQKRAPGKPLWDSGVRDALHQAAEAEGCDFPGLGPHSFRRANITWRQQVGGSSIEASKIAGHSDLEMTGEYTFVTAERQNELTRLIQQKLAQAKKPVPPAEAEFQLISQASPLIQ
jgi:hypothetical protein